MLAAPLKRVVGGLIEVLGEMVQACENIKNDRGGRVLRLSDGMKAASSGKRAFVCTEALGEHAAEHRVKLGSLNRVL